MAETQTCRRCGADLTASAFRGLCPGCLFREGLAGNDEPATQGWARGADEGERDLAVEASAVTGSSASPVSFGDYELLERLGQGGMGVVYKARQKSLDRLVAVKLLLFGPHAVPESVKRFRAEAVAAAALQHPNIVAIHEVGFWQGQHFIVMDYVEGPCLSTLIRGTPLPGRRAAGYVKAIAEAIHFAHEHGILHRDLKPANVLIDAHGQARVTDFGLARRLAGNSELTLTGQVLGSPNYMPPEQALGKGSTLSRRSDVYGLGAILYEALTGRPPFVGESVAETVQQVLNAEPLAPRALQPGVPADLETVCLKCLEKESVKRYATAQLLAEELERFLEGRPVLARPIGSVGKAWRWCRRNPRLAAAMSVALLSLLGGLAGVAWQWRQAEAERSVAEAEGLRSQQNAYASDMNLAQRALDADQISMVLGLLDKYCPKGRSEARKPKAEVDLRGWEWRYLWQLCRPDMSSSLTDAGRCRAATFSPDGRLLAAATAGKEVNIWDLSSNQRLTQLDAPGLVRAMAFSPDGRILAISRSTAGKPPVIECWKLPAPKLVRAFNPALSARSLAFSPDARLLAMLNDHGTCEILDWQSGVSLTNLPSAPLRRAETGVVVFSPDGSRVAIGADSGWLQVMDLRNHTVRKIETGTVDGVSALAFSPHSDLLAACFAYTGETVCLWDPASGESRGQLSNAVAFVRALAFSPDGRQLAAASMNGSIRLWDVAGGAEVRRLRGHPTEGMALAFGAAGRKLISACGEDTACTWDLTATNPSRPHAELAIAYGSTPNLPGKHFAAESLDPRVVHRLGFVFTPDSRNIITTQPEGTLGVRDARTMQPTESLAALGSNCWHVALSADGRWLATGEIVLTEPLIGSSTLSADGRWLPAREAEGKIRVWDWPARRLVATLEIPFEFFGHLGFSTSGRFLLGLTVRNDHAIVSRIWRTDRWEPVPFPALEGPGVYVGMALSPDERLLAIGYTEGAVKLWDFPSGRLEAVFTNQQSRVTALAFSPDGGRLASVGSDSHIFIWDVTAGRELAMPQGHSVRAWSAAFSADGRRMLTGGETPKEAVKLWDVATQRELLTLPARGQHFMQVAFSPDGNTITAISLEGVAHLWRAPDWEEIARAEKSQRTGP